MVLSTALSSVVINISSFSITKTNRHYRNIINTTCICIDFCYKKMHQVLPVIDDDRDFNTWIKFYTSVKTMQT